MSPYELLITPKSVDCDFSTTNLDYALKLLDNKDQCNTFMNSYNSNKLNRIFILYHCLCEVSHLNCSNYYSHDRSILWKKVNQKYGKSLFWYTSYIFGFLFLLPSIVALFSYIILNVKLNESYFTIFTYSSIALSLLMLLFHYIMDESTLQLVRN